MSNFIDIGYTESLSDFVLFSALGATLAFIVQRICANPKYRRKQFRKQAYPRIGWILAIGIFVMFCEFGFPMYFQKFYGVQITQDNVILYYPLNKRIELDKKYVSRSVLRKYFATKTPWYGKYILIGTRDNSSYMSIVTLQAEHALSRMRELGLP